MLQFINEQVDIYKLPVTKFPPYDQITIGDLHGNAIKLLFMLIKHEIATNISKEAYKNLVEIYKTPVDKLEKNHLKVFVSTLNSMEFHSISKVRLLGDRGSNDYFTLKILEKLTKCGIPFEIIMSNHSVEFIQAYEAKDKLKLEILWNKFVVSMLNMQSLIDKNLISEEEILTIVREVYKPALKTISYSLDEKEIIIYSHAPIGLNNIKSLAEKFNINYDDTTAEKLAQTIDEINKKYQDYVQKNEGNTLYSNENMRKGFQGYVDLSSAPIEFIMWNRLYNHIDRPVNHYDYNLFFVHGHDSSEGPKENVSHIHNLNNELGQYVRNNEGIYTVITNNNAVQLFTADKATSDNSLNENILHQRDSSANQQLLTKDQISNIKNLLINYLEHLSSSYFDIKYYSGVASELDEAKRLKLDKTRELLLKLLNNDGTFQTDIYSIDTINLLSAHRDNIAIRMLKAIRCILTLGCVPTWSFFSSRGEQVLDNIHKSLSLAK